jgi:hypothetical protein
MIAVVPLILGVQMMLQALSMEMQSSAGAAETREYPRMVHAVHRPPTDAS